MGVRLATSARKTSACYRNMYKNESSYLNSWERRTSTKKTDAPCGESWMTLEATRPNTLLGKRAIRMGNWNVRPMYETGKTFQVAAEMRAYNLALLGIRET